MSTLSLNCFVLGGDSSEVFTVETLNQYPQEQSRRLNHVYASELILSQVSLPVDDGLEESNRLVVQAPTNGEPISVFLHATDDLIDVVQRAWVPKTQEEKRGEIRSLPCIKVRVFFLLLPSLINNF
jgi:hypothetical protein